MKILLVDDEMLLLDSMESMVDWKAHNLELVGKASNAQTALQICAEQHPHLVITDIKMCNMDGLELAKQLSLQFPDIRVIIMSAYDDFSYAQKAIELKVANYLLKLNTCKSEFLHAILKVRDELEFSTSHDSFNEKNEEWFTCIKDVFLGKLDFSVLYKITTSILPPPNTYSAWIMAAACFDNGSWSVKEYFPMLSDTVQQLFPSALCIEHQNILYSFFPLKTSAQPYQHNVIRLKSQLSAQYTPCSIGVSAIVAEGQAHTAFTQAQTAAKYIFFSGKNTSVYWDNIKTEKKHASFVPAPYELFSSDIAVGNYPAINEKLTFFFHECQTNETYTKKQILQLVEYVLLALVRHSYLRTNTTFINAEIDMLESLTTLEELKKNTFQILKELHKSCLYSNVSPIISHSIEFIMDHYTQPLSLREISDYVNVSPSYLSKLFKKETGENITWYIQSVKIQYAKQMLHDSSLNVVEIANKLGFDSASYFTYLFQKHEGCTPSEYRKYDF